MKVTAIEEAQDINNMKVDELMGSLQTFQSGINEKDEKKMSVTWILKKGCPMPLCYMENN